MVVVAIAGDFTVDIGTQGLLYLEIQVDDGGKRTWFIVLNMIKGHVA